MFQKLTLGSDDDITFICDTTNDPARVITEFTKMLARKMGGHKKNDEDWGSSPFQIFEVVACRRIMLKFVDEDASEVEKGIIMRDRLEHMKNCTKCLVTFSHVAFANGQDFAFVLVMFHTLKEAKKNAKWDMANGNGFSTPDIFGVKGANAEERMIPGPCVFFKTGTYKLQGRIAAKAYAVLHTVMKTGSIKNTVECFATNIKMVDDCKLRFFANTLIGYLTKAQS